MTLRIVVDDQVERAAEAFTAPGLDLVTCPTKELTRESVRDADALVVRSTLRIDADLVDGSRLKFVGSATVGVDHVDEEALRARDIAFAAAPGSSAAGVTQFTWAMIVLACERLGRRWEDITLGVVGCGAIGGRVAATAERLGVRVLRHDPPLAHEGAPGPWASRDDLSAADVLTFHVPLSREGSYATERMIDAAFLSELAEGAVVVNIARGAILDGEAALTARRSGRLAGLVLDVFPTEPVYSRDLVAAATLVTPHVGGRSEEGLIANTAAIRSALDTTFDLGLPPWTPQLEDAGTIEGDSVAAAIRGVWSLEEMDRRLRAATTAEECADAFAALRRLRPRRRDLTSFTVAPDAPASLRDFLSALPRD